MAKTLRLSNGTELFVCDSSTPERIINVFRTPEEAKSFQLYNLTDELLTGAILDGEDITPPLDDMSYVIDPKNENITAKYFKKPDEPEPEPTPEPESYKEEEY